MIKSNGLDAAGFLLLAKGHLRQAEERLRDIPLRKKGHTAFTNIQYAINYTRSALDLLRQEKEEPCKS